MATPNGLHLAVADQLMAQDALSAQARDELGISDLTAARPLQAAFASASSFAAGAAAPLVVVPLAPQPWLVRAVAIVSVACLAILGVLDARGKSAGNSLVAPRRILGGTGDGPDRWDRNAVRNGVLNR